MTIRLKALASWLLIGLLGITLWYFTFHCLRLLGWIVTRELGGEDRAIFCQICLELFTFSKAIPRLSYYIEAGPMVSWGVFCISAMIMECRGRNVLKTGAVLWATVFCLLVFLMGAAAFLGALS